MDTFNRVSLVTVLLGFVLQHSFAQTNAEFSPTGPRVQYQAQNYIDANFGLALLDGILPFPGASFLFGRRSFRSETTFLDAELGVAFPTFATCKLGIGHLNPATGRSVACGIRPFPAHVYVQLGKEDGRCADNVGPRVARRLKRRGKDPSDILCGESIVSFELSAWLLESWLHGESPWTGYSTYHSATHEISAWSTFMVTWGYRWYLN